MRKAKKKKYPTGGVVRNYIETPQEAIAENEIALAKAKYKAETNPWAIGLEMFGNMAISYAGSQSGQAGNIGNALKGADAAFASHAMGGKGSGNAEVEGGEIVEAPGGEPVEMKGPSHAEGGIDMFLPPGTEIFSDRLKGPDGKTMAQRKKARERQIKKMEKNLADNPTDKLLKKTLDETKAQLDLQERQDMVKMEFARGFMDAATFSLGGVFDPEETKKTGPGGILYGDPDPNNPDDPYGYMTAEEIAAKSQNFLDLNQSGKYTTTNPSGYKYDPGAEDGEGNFLNKIFDGGDGTGLTFGDGVGIMGDLVSSFGPYFNTLKNRSKDRPNVNYYKDFGNDALKRMEEAMGYADAQIESGKQDIDETTQSLAKSLRGRARSVNAQRLGDTMAYSKGIEGKNALTQQYLNVMSQLFGQQASLENVQDQAVMTGEKERDIADRMDQDNYFTQMGQDIATMGTGMQKTGKDINKVKERNVTQRALNDMYENYGINVLTGEMKTIAQEDLAQNGDEYQALGIDGPTYRQKIVPKISSGEWKWEGDKIVDKDGNEVDLTTI